MNRRAVEVLVLVFSCLFSTSFSGQDYTVLPVYYTVETVDEIEYCFQINSQRFGIPVEIYRAIAQVESNYNPDALNYNRNGTFDVGLMQVNSRTAVYFGYRPEELFDVCTNVEVASLKLLECVREFGYSRKAIGCYHSKTEKHMNSYLRKISVFLEGGRQ